MHRPVLLMWKPGHATLGILVFSGVHYYFLLRMSLLKKTLESLLDCKEIKPVNPKGNQPRIFTGRTDAESEAPIPWPPDAKSRNVRKDPDAGKD